MVDENNEGKFRKTLHVTQKASINARRGSTTVSLDYNPKLIRTLKYKKY